MVATPGYSEFVTSAEGFFNLGKITWKDIRNRERTAFATINNIACAREIAKKYTAFPNPSTDGIYNLKINLKTDDDVQVTVMNAQMDVLYTEKRPLLKGENLWQVDLGGIHKGVYYAKLHTSKDHETIRLVKND
jgi:hypothetical protein